MGNWKKLLDKLEHGKKTHKPMEHSKTLLEGVLNQFIDTSDENELTIYKDAIYKHFDKFEMWYLMHNGLKLNILVCILFHRAILHLHKETERLFKEIKWIFAFRFIWQKYEGCLAEWIAGDLNAGYWRPLCSIYKTVFSSATVFSHPLKNVHWKWSGY